MGYDFFVPELKSTEVALAGGGNPVESKLTLKPMESAPMTPVTTQQAVMVASTRTREPLSAANELASQLLHDHLGCVLFFCSAEYDLENLGPALDRSFPGVRVCGCTSAGEITPNGYDRGCITAIGFDQRFFAIDCALISELGVCAAEVF